MSTQNPQNAKNARDARARKRQRTRQQLEREQKNWLKRLELIRLTAGKSFIEKAADAVICQVFAFLNVHDHWKFSRVSGRVNRISRVTQASPAKVEILENTDEKIVQHLAAFRPVRLTLFDANIRWMQTDRMPQLRELTFCSDNRDYLHFAPVEHAVLWFAELKNLVKLKMNNQFFRHLRPLPSSLTHLELLGRSDKNGFKDFDIATLFDSRHLTSLQVLKLPKNHYYDREILNVGTVFPLLREFSFGYFNEKNPVPVNFDNLKSAVNLESLAMGVDCKETICHWESLSAAIALRRLTFTIYRRELPNTLFAGLSKVTQLTHLKLTPYRSDFVLDISAAMRGLVSELTNAGATTTVAAQDALNSLPRLTSLLIDGNFIFPDASCLAPLTTLTELHFPNSTLHFPNLHCLPHLRTLHTVSYGCALEYYQDQVYTVILKDPREFPDAYVAIAVDTLLTMNQLTTLKLHPYATTKARKNTIETCVHTYCRAHLPRTVQIETDDSVED